MGGKGLKITWRQLRLFFQLSRPLFLLGGILLYALGAAIAAYLGFQIVASIYLLGQIIVTSIQLMTQYLNEYYDTTNDEENENRTPFTGGSGAIGPDKLSRDTALYSAAAAITIAATASVVLLVAGERSIVSWLIILIAFAGAFFYSSPPLKLSNSGYGELTTSFIVAGFVPALAFTLQTDELHKLVIMSTMPLIALHFAMMLAFELPDYASDLKNNKRTLMIRAGWKTGMRLHDAAIAIAGVSLVMAYLNGLPPRVVLGSLIALPLALAQLWQFERIRRGYPTRWLTLTLGAIGLFALTAYLTLVGFILS